MQNSMVKKWSFFTILLFSIGLFAFTLSPPIDYFLLKKVPIQGKSLTIDHLRSAYVIDQANQVHKYDSSGTLIGRYSENRYGDLKYVDATAPFNVLMFYQDNATLVTTDNRLNPKQYFKMSSIGIDQIGAACLSHDNYIWIFDQNESKLKKINTKYEVIYQSIEVNQLFGEEIRPNFLIERNKFVFLNDPNLGILAFDIFGNYYNSFPITGLDNFQVLNENIIFFRDGELNIFDYKASDVKRIPVPKEEAVKDVFLERSRLFVLSEGMLNIYASGQ